MYAVEALRALATSFFWGLRTSSWHHDVTITGCFFWNPGAGKYEQDPMNEQSLQPWLHLLTSTFSVDADRSRSLAVYVSSRYSLSLSLTGENFLLAPVHIARTLVNNPYALWAPDCLSCGFYCNVYRKLAVQETPISQTNRATRLEVSQGHQTCYHSIW